MRRHPELVVSLFLDKLRALQSDAAGRRWVFVPYDQLSDATGPLARQDPRTLGIVLVENPWKATRRPYHKQKLALILTNLRHFALEQAARGVAVRHVVAQGPYRTALEPLVSEFGPMRMMSPAEHELQTDLTPLVQGGDLELLPHEGWLTTAEQFRDGAGSDPPWRMDAFYRHVRRTTGVLMAQGKPVGGKFSFDRENRLSWKGEPPAPEPPTFPVDPIKAEVGRLVEKRFSNHPGRMDLHAVPGTAADADTLWSWARRECLPTFGPYEDAMSVRSRNLFHTRISSLVNIGRLLPRQVVSDVLDADIPLPSKEGFVRQVLGWREFVRHVHRVTDGFRDLPTGRPPIAKIPGDGGYNRWKGRPWAARSLWNDPDGGAQPSSLGGQTPLPPRFLGGGERVKLRRLYHR